MNNKYLLIFCILFYLSFSTKVTRQSTSVSLSLEYLGSCKDFAKDKNTLFVSNWVNATCLPIAVDGTLRDVNDIKPTQFCVNINDKKSIINFVGLPASYALSFVPTNPFRSLLSKNYIRRPNCQVKQEYMTTSLSVVGCTDNNVEIDTGYVVSDDRIYILPVGSVASTCFDTTNGCCPYINTNINNGICPNKASKKKLKLFFLNLSTPSDANRYSKDDFTIEPKKNIKETNKYGHQQNKHDKHHNDKSYAYKKNEQAEINPSVAVESKSDIKNKNEIVIEVQSNNNNENKQLGKNIVADEEQEQDDESTNDIHHSKKGMNNMANGRKGHHHHSTAHKMGGSNNKNTASSNTAASVSSPSKSNNAASPKPAASKIVSPAKSSSTTAASSFAQKKPSNKDLPPFHSLDEPSDEEDLPFSNQINFANDDQEDIYDDEPINAPQQNNGHHEQHHNRPQNKPTQPPKDESDMPADTGNIVVDNSDDGSADDFNDDVFGAETSQDDEDFNQKPNKPKNKVKVDSNTVDKSVETVHSDEKDVVEGEDDSESEDDDSIFTTSLQNSQTQKIQIHKKQNQ